MHFVVEGHWHFPISAVDTSLPTAHVAVVFSTAASRQQFTVSKCLTNILDLLFSPPVFLLILP